MVSVEGLNNRNFLNVYHLISEIKHEMEMNPNPEKQGTLTDFFYCPPTNATYGYPYYTSERVKTMLYLKSIGVILSCFHLDSSRKIYFTPIKQDDFFAFCWKIAKMYNDRFPKPSEQEVKAKSLSDEEVGKLKVLLDAIGFQIQSQELYIGEDGALLSISLPYNHFPNHIEPFDINGLLYKLSADFNIIAHPKSDKDGISFDFPLLYTKKEFDKFKNGIEARYQTILETEKQKTQSAPKTGIPQEPLKVLLVDGSKVATTSEAISKEDEYKFPHKLPSGTTWENIILKFLDDDRIYITAQGKTATVHYQDMGLHGKGDKPSVLWSLLRIFAKCSGEIAITDSEANELYKKQKQNLSDTLKNYFSIDYDPFHPYKSGKSYRTKFLIIPPKQGFSFEKKVADVPSQAPKKDTRFDDLDEFRNEIAPIVSEAELSAPQEG